MNNLIEFPIKHPWKVIIAFALIAIVLALPSTTLKQVADVSVIVNQDMKEIVLKKELEAIYGNSNFVIISIADAFNEETLQTISDITKALEARADVKKANSVFSTQHIEGGGGSFDVGDLLETVPQTPDEIEELKQKLADTPLYQGNLRSLDGNGLSIMAEFEPGTDDEVMFEVSKKMLEDHGVEDSWVISGLPVINTQVKHYMDADFQLLLPLFFLFITAVLFLSFRSLRGISVPFANIVFSIIVAMGAMALVDIPLNVVTNVIPMVLIAITSSYGIHYLTHYYIENDAYADRHEVIRQSTTHIIRIVFLSGFTTFIAFMANAFSDVKAVREFGIFVAIGVAAAVFATMFLTPAILSLLKKAKSRARTTDDSADSNSLLHRFLIGLADLILNKPMLLGAACALALAVLAVKIVDVEADYTALGFFDKSSPIVNDAREVSRNFGGINGFDIDIDSGEEEGILRADTVKVIDEFSRWIKEKYPDDIKVTVTFADYVKQMSKAYNGGEKEYYRVPDSDDEVYQYVEIYSWSGSVEEDLRNIVTPDYRRTKIHGRFALIEHADGTWEESSITYVNDVLVDAVGWLQERLPEGVKVQQYGVLPMWMQVQLDIIAGQINAILIAMVAILIIVMLVFRSVSAGIIGIIPVATAVIAIFGVMGWSGILLEIGTSLVAAMAIGIGIDDTMYFMITYRSALRSGLDTAAAIKKTFSVAGRAILYTSFALVAGYAILMLSNFKVIQYFAMLNLIAIVATTIGALVVLPLMVLFAQKRLGVRF